MINIRTDRRAYFFLLLSIWLAIVFVILGIIVFFWIHVGKIFYDRTAEFAEKYTTQARNAIDITIEQLDLSIRQSLFDRNLRDYMEYPLGKYYESISGGIVSEDSTGLYYYLNTKEKLKDTLSNKKMSNDFLSSVYFYDVEKKFFLTSNGNQYSLEDFPDVDCIRYIQDNPDRESGRIIKEPRVEGAINKNKLILSFVYYAKTHPFLATKIIIANLDLVRFAADLFADLNWWEGGGLFVISDKSVILLSTQPQYIGREVNLIKHLILFETHDRKGNLEIVPYRDDVKLQQIRSRVLDWTFVTVAADSGIYRDVSRINVFFLIATITGLMVSVLPAFFIGRSLFKPVSEILALVEPKRNAKRDVLEFWKVAKYLKERKVAEADLRERLCIYLPGHRERLFRGIIHDTLSLEEKEELISADPAMDRPDMPVVVAESDLSCLETQVRKELCRAIGRRYQFDVLPGKDTIVFFLYFSHGDMQELTTYMSETCASLSKKSGRSIRMGMGEVMALRDSRISYKQARTALFHLIARDREGVFSDIAESPPSGTCELNLKEMQATLSTLVKCGNVQAAVSIFEEIVGKIEESSHMLRVVRIRLELTNAVLLLLDSMAYYDDELEAEKQYTEIMERVHFKSPSEILRYIKGLNLHFQGRDLHDSKNDPHNHVQRAKDILETRYMKDISLQETARELGLTPEYLSLLFKKGEGCTFVEYLTSLRMRYAAELLGDPNIRISDVSLRVGYGNSDYFIKVFRKHMGITPGKYQRKLHAGENLR